MEKLSLMPSQVFVAWIKKKKKDYIAMWNTSTDPPTIVDISTFNQLELQQ